MLHLLSGGSPNSRSMAVAMDRLRWCQHAACIAWCSQALIYWCRFPLQATILVYQAVAEYWVNSKEPEYNVKVDVLMPGRSMPEKYIVNEDNHYTTRTTKVKSITWMQVCKPEFNLLTFLPPHQVNTINQNVTVTATGFGEVTVKVRRWWRPVLTGRSSPINPLCSSLPGRCCRCITPCPRKSPATARNLTCRCSSSQVRQHLLRFREKRKKKPNGERMFLHLQIKQMRMRKCTSWE